MAEKDKRSQKRYPVSIDVTVNTPNITFPATAINISGNGIGIQTLKNIPPGIQATIVMNIPEPVTLYATLIWSRHTLIKNLDGYEMGFEIYAMIYQGSVHDEPHMREKVVQAILAA